MMRRIRAEIILGLSLLAMAPANANTNTGLAYEANFLPHWAYSDTYGSERFQYHIALGPVKLKQHYWTSMPSANLSVGEAVRQVTGAAPRPGLRNVNESCRSFVAWDGLRKEFRNSLSEAYPDPKPPVTSFARADHEKKVVQLRAQRASLFERVESVCAEKTKIPVPKIASRTKASLAIRSLSPNGSSWEIELTYQNEAFRSLLMSKRDFLKIRFPVRIRDCDGQALVSPVARLDGDVARIIESFRELRPSDFYMCTFLVEHDRIVIGDKAAEGWILETEDFYGHGYLLTLLETGDLSFARPEDRRGDHPVMLFKAPKPANLQAAREKAVRATKVFTNSLKAHAQTLLELALSEASLEAIQAASQDSIADRREGLLKALGEINEAFPMLSFLDKLNVTYSINTVYEAVRRAEIDKLRLFERRARMDLGDTLIRDRD